MSIVVERDLTVDRSRTAVRAYLADFTHTEQWDPGTVRTTRTDDGPLRVGSRFHNVSRFRGRETELDYRVVRLDPDRLTFTGDNPTVEATDDLTLAGDDAHTTIHYRATFRFKGWARLAEPFLRRTLDRVADETIEQLARTLLADLPA